MEVHHPDLKHERKYFKEYFLEFLMIFLAVMMGFFAENFRETTSEHSRAKEFATSYYDDLKKDSAALETALHFSNSKLIAMDSALTILHQPVRQQQDTLLYLNLGIGTVIVHFEPCEGTYEQIKSSGSLHYFKQRLVSLMNGYDLQVKKTLRREDIDLKFITEQYIPFSVKNFNTEVVYDARYNRRISHELYFADRCLENMRQLINEIVVI